MDLIMKNLQFALSSLLVVASILFSSSVSADKISLISNINVSDFDGNSNPDNFITLNNKLYFSAEDGSHGDELHVYDPLTEETTLIEDLNSGIASSNPNTLITFNNKLYFSATDGASIGLFVYDDSTKAVSLVKDFFGDESNIQFHHGVIKNLMVYKGKLYITTFSESIDWYEVNLYSYDDSTSETTKLQKLYTIPWFGIDNNLSDGADLFQHNDTLFVRIKSSEFQGWGLGKLNLTTNTVEPMQNTKGLIIKSSQHYLGDLYITGTQGSDKGLFIYKGDEEIFNLVGAEGSQQHIDFSHGPLYTFNEKLLIPGAVNGSLSGLYTFDNESFVEAINTKEASTTANYLSLIKEYNKQLYMLFDTGEFSVFDSLSNEVSTIESLDIYDDYQILKPYHILSPKGERLAILKNKLYFGAYHDLHPDIGTELFSYHSNHLPTGTLSIEGTSTPESTLSAVVQIEDSDGMTEFSYSWHRNGNIIANQTTENYITTSEDIGTQITVKISYTDLEGTYEEITSAPLTISVVSEEIPVIDKNESSGGSIPLFWLVLVLTIRAFYKKHSSIAK